MAIRKGLALATALALAGPAVAQETIQTRIGPLSFTHGFESGYSTDETVQRLYDERDFQRAVQAYPWAIPFVSMAQWRWSHENELGAENGQIVFVESYRDKLGGLTYNVTTPYVLPFIDLADGPWVLEMPGPEGAVRGAADQRHPARDPPDAGGPRRAHATARAGEGLPARRAR
jgi:hypothetical protein